MMKRIIELFAWYGAIVILGAYILLEFSFLKPSDIAYQLLNFTGSFGILVHAYEKRDYQPVLLNIIWAIIAFLVIVRLIFHSSTI